MKTLTLRNLPPDVAKAVQRRAREKGTSVTKAVVSLLEEAAGIRGKKRGTVVYHDLDDLFGSMSAKDAVQLEQAIREQRMVDKGLWK